MDTLKSPYKAIRMTPRNRVSVDEPYPELIQKAQAELRVAYAAPEMLDILKYLLMTNSIIGDVNRYRVECAIKQAEEK